MKKVLRSETIIPPELYVQRSADRQLQAVIDDMGRPGYVLVARQMGKTNLLFNAKHRLQERGDIVAYIDLSTRTRNLRALFRHVIDVLIEASSIFEEATEWISRQRREDSWDANFEYDRHLRRLLSLVGDRRVIIIFDEVDSLMSVPYSDPFFAQIRSMYFSRINYAEYMKLTYVLSGVAEPGELIKDKNISPFNIGEKIYLEDFSREEFDDFLVRADLKFTDEIKNTIFDWTGGNPRMTWDLCSEVEDKLIQVGHVDRRDVDEAVDKLYLQRFDRAPVDHIRTLVESDPALQSAIQSIRYNKGDTLDERIVSKLYLAGITPAATRSALRIKNRIIDAALSDRWILNLAASKQDVLAVSATHFAANRFKDVATLLRERIAEFADNEALPTLQFMYGVSAYHTGDYEEALRQLTLAFSSKSTDQEQIHYYLGLTYLRLGRLSDAVHHLGTAARDERFRLTALVNISSIYILQADQSQYGKVIELCGEVLEHFRQKVGTPFDFGNAPVMALYNLAQVWERKGDKARADEYLREALEMAAPEPRVAILAYHITRIQRAKAVVAAKDAARVILDGHLSFGSKSDDLALTEESASVILATLVDSQEPDLFDELLDYLCRVHYPNRTRLSVLCHLTQLKFRDQPYVVRRFVPFLLNRYTDSEELKPFLLDLHRLLAVHAPASLSGKAFSVYYSLLQRSIDAGLGGTADDLSMLLSHCSELLSAKRAAAAERAAISALQLIDLMQRNEPLDSENVWRTVFLNIQMRSLLAAGNQSAARAVATELLSIDISPLSPTQSELLGVMESLRKEAQNIVRVSVRDPLRLLGRNDRVTVRDRITGKMETRKFKHVEDDLRSGRLELMTAPNSTDENA